MNATNQPVLWKPETLTKEYIREMVATDQRWLERAIISLYQYQTDSERASRASKLNNKVGFNKPDANILSKMATWLMRSPQNHLTGYFLNKAKGLVPKYSGQLLAISMLRIEEAKRATPDPLHEAMERGGLNGGL